MAALDITPARELLASTKLSDLLKPQHVVVVKQNASVDQALRVRYLSVRDVLRVP
jgi:hypothetical protein